MQQVEEVLSRSEVVRIACMAKGAVSVTSLVTTGAKVTISRLEQKCSVLEESHRRVQSQVVELEGELEASRDREALVNTQLSKAVAQAERMAGERDSLAQIVSLKPQWNLATVPAWFTRSAHPPLSSSPIKSWLPQNK